MFNILVFFVLFNSSFVFFFQQFFFFPIFFYAHCRNPTLAKCEDEIHTPKVGDLKSSGTPECLEFDSRGQKTSHLGCS